MRLFSYLFISLLCYSCYQPERNCKDFKTGTYTFEALLGTKIESTTFVRNDSIEIDYFRGKADTSIIRWINNCEYIIKKKYPKNKSEEKAVHVKILETQNNQYTFEYNIVGSNTKQKGTAIESKLKL